MFVVSVLCFNMREERSLVKKDLRTVDALQVGPVRQLGVSGQDVFFQLVGLTERLLAVIAHVQVLLQVAVSSRSLLSSISLAPQSEMLSVLTVSLPESQTFRREDACTATILTCSHAARLCLLISWSVQQVTLTCMWLCSDEVEEKPRLHTLHLNGLLELGGALKEENRVEISTDSERFPLLISSEAVTCASSGGSLGDQSERKQPHTPDSCTSYLLNH